MVEKLSVGRKTDNGLSCETSTKQKVSAEETEAKEGNAMRKFVLETDWYTDVDDCVALRFLIRSLDEQHVLLGVNINSPCLKAYASIKAFMQNENFDCPVALDREDQYTGKALYQSRMAGDSELTNTDAERTLDFYRRILGENEGVEIISIGFLNSLEEVFKAYPELAEKKISKIWCMGGRWDREGEKNWNFSEKGNPTAMRASRFIVNETNVPMTFLGWECGHSVITGGKLPEEDMLKQALNDFGFGDGRSSWDPMTAALALEDKYGLLFDRKKYTVRLDEECRNFFTPDENSNREILSKLYPDAFYEDLINRVIE